MSALELALRELRRQFTKCANYSTPLVTVEVTEIKKNRYCEQREAIQNHVSCRRYSGLPRAKEALAMAIIPLLPLALPPQSQLGSG